MFKKLMLSIIVSGLSINSFADVKLSTETDGVKDIDNTSLVNKDSSTDSIKESFKEFFGGSVISYIADAKIDNSYLVLLNDGTKMIYFKDTNYAIVGDLYDLKNRQNMTNKIMSSYNIEIINQIKDKGIDYPIKDGVDKLDTVYVFTDPTCGYCRKLNNEIDKYGELGINIVYLPYSRSGENTRSNRELIDVWCSVDKKLAMNMSKEDRGEEIKDLEGYELTEECAKVVSDSEALGRKLGIQGTPALYTSNGTSFPGYIPAVELKKILDNSKLSN